MTLVEDTPPPTPVVTVDVADPLEGRPCGYPDGRRADLKVTTGPGRSPLFRCLQHFAEMRDALSATSDIEYSAQAEKLIQEESKNDS